MSRDYVSILVKSYRAPLLFLLFLFALSAGAYSQTAKPIALRPITVITEPNAVVWVDGVRYGSTDDKGRLSISTVLPGVRMIRVRANGFAEVSRSLPAATRGDVTFKLVKTTDEAELAFQNAETNLTVDREKSIAEYNRAVKIRPRYFEAYIGLARAYSERGEIEKAYKALQSAKRIRPADAETAVIEGRILKDSDEEVKAIAAFKRAISLGRGFQPEAYTGLGLLYKDRAENAAGSADFESEASNYDESIKHLATAVKQLGSSPDAMVVYQLLGLIYERQKRYKEAIALYEDFLRIFPDTSEAGAVQSFIVQIKKQMAEPE